MLFSIYNTPASWQVYINKVLGPLFYNTCVAFLDDILIWEDSDKKVKVRTFKTFNYLRKKGLYCKLSKYYIKINEVNFLEYLVSYNKLYINSN